MRWIWFILFISQNFCFAQNISTPEVYLIDNQYILSPSWAGIGPYFKFRAISASRFADVDDAPATYIASLSGRIHGRSGIGMILENNVNGYTGILTVNGSYAYHLSINDDNNEFLSFGLSVKYSRISTDTSEFINVQNDPAVEANRQITEVNFDAGILYRRQRFFINFDLTDLINKSGEYTEGEPLYTPTINLYSGYHLALKKDLLIIPSFRYQNFTHDKRSELDLNFKLQKNTRESNYWAATVLKFQTGTALKGMSFTPLAGFKFLKFYASYGYQIMLNIADTGLNFNHHMFGVGFDFINLSKAYKCVQ